MEKEYKKIDLDYINGESVSSDEFNEDDVEQIFRISDDVVYMDIKKEREHSDCMRTPDGRHKFGAIGGGYWRRFYMNDNGEYELIAHCEGCGKSCNITEEAKKVTDDDRETEEYKAAQERKKYRYRMDKIEYLRFKAFCDERKGDHFSVGWMGTGLGCIIDVRDEDTKECADITDFECW